MHMTTRNSIRRALTEEIRSQLDEINKYKWIESEKVGRDIGWERASSDWLQNYFQEWKRHRWQRALRDALRHTDFPRMRQSQLN